MNLKDRQPTINTVVDGELNIINIVDVRRLANGAKYTGDLNHLVRVLARATVDLTEKIKGEDA